MSQAILSDERAEWLRDHGMGLSLLADDLGDRAAIISEAGNRSFTELNANANKLVRYFRSKGMQVDDGVAVLSANGPELVEIIYACLRGGFRVTPINWHQTNDEIAYVVANCEAKVFFTWGGQFDETARQAAQGSSHLVAKVAFASSLEGFEDYQRIMDTESGDNITDPESGNLMLYTSGTTGRPKGVYRKKRPLTSPLNDKIVESTAFQPTADMSLVTGPLYHAAPLGLNLLLPLGSGVTCVLMDKWDAEQTLATIEKYKITFTHVVPTMFQRLLALPDEIKGKYDISSLRYIIHGAAPCPVHIKQQAMDWFGPVIYEYYAATEGGSVYCEPEQWLKKPGTVGVISPGGVIKILDDAGKELSCGEDGTIYFAAPEDKDTKFSYFKDTEKTDNTYRGELFTMGDVGHLDEEGYLFLTGRTAELVICGGVNVYPAQIDEVLSRHEAIADVATIGVPNEEFGEEIKAIVELESGLQPTQELAQSVLNFGREKLKGFMRPRSIEFIETMPRSPSGKILRQRLKERYNP